MSVDAPNLNTITSKIAPSEDTKPAEEVKLVAMELTRNYVPKGMTRIVGWNRPEKTAKDAAGRKHVVQEAAFVEGEMAPGIFPGVGYPNKIWASTVIEVPQDEAREMRAKGIGEAYL